MHESHSHTVEGHVYLYQSSHMVIGLRPVALLELYEPFRIMCAAVRRLCTAVLGPVPRPWGGGLLMLTCWPRPL